MKKLKLYIASSLDGFIAREDGDLKWLTEAPNPENDDHGYAAFLETVDTVLMGNSTYKWVVAEGMPDPYPDKKNFVFTRGEAGTTGNINYINDDPVVFTSELKKGDGKDIFLVGGGELIRQLLAAGLIDEMIIFIVPVFLGRGIRLFPETENPLTLNYLVTKVEVRSNGFIELNVIRTRIHTD